MNKKINHRNSKSLAYQTEKHQTQCVRCDRFFNLYTNGICKVPYNGLYGRLFHCNNHASMIIQDEVIEATRKERLAESSEEGDEDLDDWLLEEAEYDELILDSEEPDG